MSGEDLRAILGLREESFAAELRENRLDEVSAQRVLRRSRRALRVRSVAIAAVAAVAVTIAGVGVWALTGQQHREPLVAPPSPTAVTIFASPTPTPTPTPSPSPTIVFSEPLPADGFFLEAQQLTESVWLAADDGWSLTYWQPSRQSRTVDSQDVTDPGVAAIYLMDNNGNRYEVSHFDVPVDASIELVAWEPTKFTATVIHWAKVGDSWNKELAVLDLRTGDITLSDVVAPPAVFLGVNSDNNLLFSTGELREDVTVLTRSLDVVGVLPGLGSARQLSPDGTTLVHVTDNNRSGQPVGFEAYSTTTGEGLWSQDVSAVASGLDCFSWGWITRNTPALTCREHAPDSSPDYTAGGPGRTTFFAVDQDGVSAAVERPGDLTWGSPYPLPAGLVSCGGDPFDGGDSCSLYYIEGASLVPVPTQTGSMAGYSFAESGDVVALKALTDVGGPPLSVTATRYDTGVTFTITPRQQDDPTWSWTTMSGVVIAGAVGPAF